MLNLATHNINSSPVLKRPSARLIASPFGSSLPNRAWSDVSRVYRYGFNGKEKDFETASDAYDFGARIYDGRLGRWLSLDFYFNRYPGSAPYASFINKPIVFSDPDGRDVIILIWATKYRDVGHTAIAVQDYEEVTEKITEEIWAPNENPTPEDIKSGNIGEWVTITTGERKVKKPIDSYTIYELGPNSALSKGSADANVNPSYFVTKGWTLEELTNKEVSKYDNNSADGVILLDTDNELDEKLKYELGITIPNSSATNCYNGIRNNCSDYGKKASEIASGEEINAEEKVNGNEITTPNKLYNATSKLNNATVLKNADSKTKNSFIKSFINIFKK